MGKAEEPLEVPRELVDTFLGGADGVAVEVGQLERLAKLGLVRLHGKRSSSSGPNCWKPLRS